MRTLTPQTGIVLAVQAAILAVLLERPLALGLLAAAAAGYWLWGGGARHLVWVLGLAALVTWSPNGRVISWNMAGEYGGPDVWNADMDQLLVNAASWISEGE